MSTEALLWTDETWVRTAIVEECDAVKALLIRKNGQYGNSALEPIRVFSCASVADGLCVRIDDKLARVRTMGFGAADEDTVMDLLGYLVLLRVAQRAKGDA